MELETSSTPVHKNRLLLIDDDQDQLAMFKYLLEDCGYEVLTTCQPLDAIGLMHKESIDLVICDVAMPKMTGPQFVKTLKSTSSLSSKPVILITAGEDALGHTKVDFHNVDFKADGFCLKKHASTMLLAQIESLLN